MSDMTAPQTHSSVVLTLSTMTQPAQTNSLLSIRFILAVAMSDEGGLSFYICLPAVSTVLRIVPVDAFAELNMLCEIWQREVARRVHISTFLPSWFKPIGSDNTHPANTDLFLNSITNKTICQGNKKINISMCVCVCVGVCIGSQSNTNVYNIYAFVNPL